MGGVMRFRLFLIVILIILLTSSGCISQTKSNNNPSSPYQQSSGASLTSDSGIHKIKHIVIIMQENRAFDNYFGTYPGANGIPMKNGTFLVHVLDPATGQYIPPYHSTSDIEQGGPHGAVDSVNDINGGRMDGFIAQQEAGKNVNTSLISQQYGNYTAPDVMGYHDRREIPKLGICRQFCIARSDV